MSSWTTFRWHPVELFLVLVTGAGYVHVVRDGRLRRRALSGVAALLMVTAWPIGNLAASVSLSVATLQRLVVMLLVAPLLLTATPVSVLNRVTRPTAIDALARRLAHQCVAMLTVTIMGTATLTPSLVDWGPGLRGSSASSNSPPSARASCSGFSPSECCPAPGSSRPRPARATCSRLRSS